MLVAGGRALSALFVRQERKRQTVQEGLLRRYAQRARIESEQISTLYLVSGVEAFIRADRGEVHAEEICRVLTILYGNSHAIRNIGIVPGNRISHVDPLAGNERAIALYYPDNP
ncbi:hypothetical protein [Uliginosibacterium sp. TH139]|uniref:hypothetical protein n=1 Tax=Uliginosibacterium sp. TH139 TaxID=2067453 RepID=UPI000C7ABC2A|nr:hypothetical protein [Uliginosibacterium sp. TH139]PLK49917.1 hypothetical protein C0V76_05740 [Uliginosibacterium sp. TH139]